MNELKPPQKDRLPDAWAVLNNHFTDPNFTVKKWAAALNMTVPYLSKLLRERTGKPPSVHLRDARLAHAQDLLTQTDNAVLDIASASGFSDNNYFSRVFHAVFKSSPSAWRLIHQKR
jgi:two-component system, response regulator YesN